MRLLIDQNIETEVLTESTIEGDKRMYITGPFLMHTKQNRNKRIYSKKGMDNAVKAYTEEYIKSNRAMGEMSHPAGRLQIDPERACILTTELTPDGNHYMGKARVLSTPMGKILEALLSDGVRIGVSSRGVGSVSKRGDTTYVGDDFALHVAADVVTDPSVGDAFVQHLMEEKEYIFENGLLVEKDIVDARNQVKRAKTSELQEMKLQVFANFIDKISSRLK